MAQKNNKNTEKAGNPETIQKTEQPVNNEEAAIEKELEKEEALPFPNSRVVNLIRQELDEGKIIRARVKKDMNEWLGKMCKNIAKELNKSPYSTIEAGDLHRILKKYEGFEELAKQKERLRTALERIIQDAQMLVNDLERVKTE